MLTNFQLVAVVKKGMQRQLLHVSLVQELQDTLAKDWQVQLDTFLSGSALLSFDPGYTPEAHECFVLGGFVAPDWLSGTTSTNAPNLGELGKNEAILDQVAAVAAFARDGNGDEVVLFQSFSRSHVILPGGFLFLSGDTYRTADSRGLRLGSRLCAVWRRADEQLLFSNFRTVNAFLPLGDNYEEASEKQIREVLTHPLLDVEDADRLVRDANQWSRRRFAMLLDSRVLDDHSPKDIRKRSKGYGLDVTVRGGKIVFPADPPAAKKLLQFLNEELYKGPITDTLFETNSKREAD